MKQLPFLALLLLLILISQGPAGAALVDFSMEIKAAQVVEDVTSPATGAGWLELDTETNTIEWSIIYSDLTSQPAAAHFHGPAPAGVNAGAQVTLDHTTNPMIGSAQITAQQQDDLLNDLWYVNIHTSTYPQGEIRGQITNVIPEPATVVLLGLGSLVVLLPARKY